jgi:hypothetical protein
MQHYREGAMSPAWKTVGFRDGAGPDGCPALIDEIDEQLFPIRHLI